MENAAWCAGMVLAANYYLPLLGFNVTGSTTVDPTDTDISDVLSTIASHNPHIIFTAFSGSVGAVYSVQRASLGIPAVTIGINVPGQQLSHWANTAGDCEGEIMLDTWAVGLNNTASTSAWFNNFVTTFGIYPVYTAGTYDAIKNMCHAIEATNSVDSDTLVAWLEDPDNMMADSVASEKVGTFPMPDVTINATLGQYGLSESLVADYYNLTSYGKTYNSTDWLCGYWGTTQQPNIAHDLLYGPGYATGIGSQWQVIGGAGKKVGVWPFYVPGYDTALTDQYGNWNFAYPGTEPTRLLIGGMLTIPWDPYA
jgi:branched-chain amino acid transport system substrate-binding protein